MQGNLQLIYFKSLKSFLPKPLNMNIIYKWCILDFISQFQIFNMHDFINKFSIHFLYTLIVMMNFEYTTSILVIFFSTLLAHP